MIGHLFTLFAMILVALEAADAMLSHMDCSFWIYRLPFVIFGLEVDLTGLNFHDGSTGTGSQILVTLHVALQKRLFDFLDLFFAQIVFQFVIFELRLALRTLTFLVKAQSEFGILHEALLMHCVETVGSLEHQFIVQAFNDILVAKVTLGEDIPCTDLFKELLLLFDEFL